LDRTKTKTKMTTKTKNENEDDNVSLLGLAWAGLDWTWLLVSVSGILFLYLVSCIFHSGVLHCLCYHPHLSLSLLSRAFFCISSS
jgi:hypothetical protein